MSETTPNCGHCCRCWCCTPIGPGPGTREPLSPRTMERIQEQADELVRLYYEVHPDQRPGTGPMETQ